MSILTLLALALSIAAIWSSWKRDDSLQDLAEANQVISELLVDATRALSKHAQVSPAHLSEIIREARKERVTRCACPRCRQVCLNEGWTPAEVPKATVQK